MAGHLLTERDWADAQTITAAVRRERLRHMDRLPEMASAQGVMLTVRFGAKVATMMCSRVGTQTPREYERRGRARLTWWPHPKRRSAAPARAGKPAAVRQDGPAA